MSHMLPSYSPTSLFGGHEVFCASAPSDTTELCPVTLAAKSFADLISTVDKLASGNVVPFTLSVPDILVSLGRLLRELDPATATAQKRLLDVSGRDALFERAYDHLFSSLQTGDPTPPEILDEIFGDTFDTLFEEMTSADTSARPVLSQETIDALLGFEDTTVEDTDVTADDGGRPCAPDNIFLMTTTKGTVTLCPNTAAAFIFATFVIDTVELQQSLDSKIRTDIQAFAEALLTIFTGWKLIIAKSGNDQSRTFRSALAFLRDHA
ncbi:MAG: hypothetical protein JKY60_06005 [Kordiimonadaceae bacterium]|nr:hypothetical protein [Kordiimonadaceae bacterium]